MLSTFHSPPFQWVSRGGGYVLPISQPSLTPHRAPSSPSLTRGVRHRPAPLTSLHTSSNTSLLISVRGDEGELLNDAVWRSNISQGNQAMTSAMTSSLTSAEPPPFPAGYPSGYTWPHIICASVVVTVVILIIVVGNLLVMWAICKDKNLKGPQNYFIGSLALADFLLGLLIVPFSLANELMGHWHFGTVFCEVWKAVDVLLCTASISSLCLISLDRYWSITKALHYSRQRTPKRAAVMIFFVWFVSAAICIPPLIGWNQPAPDSDWPICALSEDIGYVLYSSMGSFYIPAFIMLFVYFKIYQAARARARKSVSSTPRVSQRERNEQKASTESSGTDTQQQDRATVHGLNNSLAHHVPADEYKLRKLKTRPHPTSHVKEDGDQGPTSPPQCRCVNHMADDCLANPPPASSCNHALPPSAKAACGHTLASSSISTSRDSLNSAVHFLQQATSSLASAVQLLDQATSSLAAAGCEDGGRQTGGFRCRSLSLPGRPLRPWDELTRLISVDSGSCDAADGSALNLMDRSRSCSYNMSTATYTTSATETDSSMDRPGAAPRRLPDGPRLVSYNSRDISFPMVLLLGKSPNDTVTVAASMAEISAPRNARTDRCLQPKESKQKGLSERPQVRKDKDNGHAPSGILGSLRRQLHRNNNSKTEREGPEHQPNTPPQKKSAKKVGRREDFSSVERHKRKVAKARERRATLVLGLVMAAFILCWLPFFLLYVASAFCEGCIPMMVFTVFFWIGYCNSALNPIIYTVFNRDFRRAFHRILCGRGPARP